MGMKLEFLKGEGPVFEKPIVTEADVTPHRWKRGKQQTYLCV